MPSAAYVALGGNLGNVPETFAEAIRRLESHPEIEVIARSRNFRTLPVGEASGGEFLNAAVKLYTALEPLALLDELQRIETELGRERPYRWSPRTLDLDLILYGDRIIDDPRLKVPHPAAWHRRFVLDPLCDIAADVVHPVQGRTIAVLRERLQQRPLPVVLAGGDDPLRRELMQAAQERFGERIVLADAGSPPEGEAMLTVVLGGDGQRLELSGLPNQLCEALIDVLSAALDEPQALAGDGLE